MNRVNVLSPQWWHSNRYPPAALAPFPRGRTFGGPTTRARRVLVADDEIHIVDLLAILLEEEGFQVLRARDGEEAWELVVRSRPDLVISDVMMPRASGLELLHRMRGADGLRHTPVILMSAAARQIEGEGAAFLAKPFDIDRMLSLVEAELAG